jgi:hypothetical protein
VDARQDAIEALQRLLLRRVAVALGLPSLLLGTTADRAAMMVRCQSLLTQ